MKKLVTQRNNYKNVSHTIATNHQIAFATSLCRKNLFTFELETNGCSRVNAASVFEQFSYCPTASDMITNVKRLTVDGIDYSFGKVLCVGVSINGIPDLKSINEILLDNSDVFFVGTVLETVCFDEHFHGWQVIDTLNCAFCKHEDLIYAHPLYVRVQFGLFQKYVCSKFCLETASSIYRI